jgi:hypothetical protein
MNLHLIGEREVTVKKTGHTSIQHVRFDLYQTPTDVTKEAIRGNDPKGVYVAWVLSHSDDEQVARYADDDCFSEGEPVGFDTYNAGVEHIKELEAFLNMCDHEGYDVEFCEM